MIGRRRAISLRCSLDIENTAESLHAHAIPEDVELRAGDVVVLHDIDPEIGFGERRTGEARASLIRANPLTRFWTEWRALFEIADLYEVGFDTRAEIDAALGRAGG